MKVIINPYHKSVTIDGVEVVQKFINFPDALNHLASISCDYDRDSQTITDVQDVHRYVSHAIEKQYYYKHLPEFVDWFYAEQQAQLDNAISVEQQIVAANTAAQNAATSAEKAKLEAEEAKKTNQNTQQAVDNAVAKLTQAGSTLPVKSDGTDISRTLGERFADIINVRDFGAKGDGITDDTEAIQAAIDSAGGSEVFFPRGVYTISDTVYVRDRKFGTIGLNLAGSEIIWNGANLGTMIVVQSTRAYVRNGTLRGCANADSESKAGLCLKLLGFHSAAKDLHILNYVNHGMMIGDEDHTGSIGAVCSNIMISTDGGNPAYSGVGGPNGITVWAPDSQFDNILILRCHHDVHLHTSGNVFSNCHFVAVYPEKKSLTALQDSVAIYYDISNLSWYVNTFNNCYFDDHKYCVYSANNHLHVTLINNSFAFDSGSWVSDDVSTYQRFMAGGGRTHIKSENFVALMGARVQFFDSSLSTPVSLYSSACTKDYYAKNSFVISQQNILPYLANYKVQDGESIPVISPSMSIPANSLLCIGGVILPNSSGIGNFTPIELSIFNRSYGGGTIKIQYINAESKFYVDVADVKRKIAGITVKIGVAEHINICGIDSMFIPIYLFTSTNITPSLNTCIYANIKTNGFMSAYLVNNGQGITDRVSESYIAEVNLDDNIDGFGQLYESTGQVSDFNAISEAGIYQITWDANSLNAPTESGFGLLEVFALRSQAGWSNNTRIIQRITRGTDSNASAAQMYVRAQGGSRWWDWKNVSYV